MRFLWKVCLLAGCLAGLQSPALSQTTPEAPMNREQLRQYLTTVPYSGSDAEICTMAVAALNRAQQAEPEPVVGHVGSVDCGQDFAAAGFAVWTEGSSQTFRRVNRPGQLNLSAVLVSVDYICNQSSCYGTAFYMLPQEEGIWTTGDQIFVMP